MNEVPKEKKKNEFHAYWQCPKCEKVNIDTATDTCFEMKKFECKHCNLKVNLIKKITQVLCNPLTFYQDRV